MVASQTAVCQRDRQFRFCESCQGAIWDRGRRVCQSVLQRQSQGCQVPRRNEKTHQRSRGHQRADHDRWRRWLGNSDAAKRTAAVENHYKWVDAAKYLGCHSIRVNAETDKPYEEGSKLAADGLRRLSEYAKPLGINVIVENHGGLSSNGKWLAETIRATGMENCGTLPDFGNFYEYDRYQGVTDLMPLAKAVSAKSYDFDADGNETKIDFAKMMKIVLDAGYRGWVGIEYEGSKLSPDDGIKATKKLLEKIRQSVAVK